MASGSSLTLLEDLFLCTICFHEYDNVDRKAKLLPCHHTFCSLCLASLINSSLLKCPLCSDVSSVTTINTLKHNHYLSQFADVLKSFNQSQSIPNSPILDSEKFCKKHGNTEKFFWCKTCACMVCIHCMGLEHKVEKGHEVSDVSEATDNLRRQVLNTLSLINSKIADLRNKRNEASNSLDLKALRAADAIRNVTSGATETVLNMINDKTLNPKNYASRFNASSEFLNQGIVGLDRAEKELREILSYFLSMNNFVEQKLMETRVQKKSQIIVGFLHPETDFDYGKMYCVRCGKMCDFPQPLPVGKNNPYGEPLILNHCSKCSITMLQFS